MNKKDKTGFFKTHYDCQRGWMLNIYPIKMLGGTEVKINDNKYNITPRLQKVFTQTSNIPLKNLKDQEREIYKNILKDLNFENDKAVSGGNKSDKYKRSKTIFKNDLKGQGIQKIIKPSKKIDIYTRLELLLGLKLSAHTDTLTEASNLIGELYRVVEIQNEQQYRNALDKFLKNLNGGSN